MEPWLSRMLDRVVIRKVIFDLGKRVHDPGKLQGAPSFNAFFREPKIHSVSPVFRRGKDSQHLDFSFDSPVQSGCLENDITRGRLFRGCCRGRQHGAIVMLHGWVASSYFQFARIARTVSQWGYDVYLLQLPYHIERSFPGTHSGEFALSADLNRSLAAMQQTVCEVRALTHWIRKTQGLSTGVIGFSYGGWLAGLTACAESELDFAILTIPVVGVDHVLWESPIGKNIKRDLLKFQVSGTEWKQALSVTELMHLQPAFAPERIGIIVARYDVFIPFELSREFMFRWPKSQRTICPNGHIDILFSQRMLWNMRKMLEGFRKGSSKFAGGKDMKT